MHLNFLETQMNCSDTLMGLTAFINEPKKRRILIVDDEPGIRTTLSGVLEIQGFYVETASCAREATQKLEAAVFDLIITDMRMETDFAGCDVIRAARQQPYHPAVVILSAFPSCTNEYGVQAIFAKGNNVVELLRTVEELLTRPRSKSSNS
jgi:CheY-like chemotaxis protein